MHSFRIVEHQHGLVVAALICHRHQRTNLFPLSTIVKWPVSLLPPSVSKSPIWVQRGSVGTKMWIHSSFVWVVVYTNIKWTIHSQNYSDTKYPPLKERNRHICGSVFSRVVTVDGNGPRTSLPLNQPGYWRVHASLTMLRYNPWWMYTYLERLPVKCNLWVRLINGTTWY